MNKLSIGVLAAGLLLSASAMAQNNTTTDTQKSATPSSTSTTQAKPDTDAGRLQNDRSRDTNRTQVQGDQDRRASERAERHERSGSMSTRTRSTVGLRIHDREEYRHRRGYRTEVRFGHSHCRNIIVKKRFHHRVVVRHIHRCF